MTVHFHKTQQDLILQAFKAGRNSHAQLFMGPAGNGKLELALWYAALMLCQQPTDHGPCGVCSSCLQNKAFTHPDLQFIFPTPSAAAEKLKALSIEFMPQWRDLLQQNAFFSFDDWKRATGNYEKSFEIRVAEADQISKNLSYKSYAGGYKVVLVWLAEWMNVATANKILKNIEEPEDRTLILLVCEQADRLLPTIRSRVQSVFFPPLQVSECANYLTSIGVKEANEIARIADGNLHQALSFLESNEGVREMGVLFARWMRVCYTVNMKEILSISDLLSKKSRSYTENFLRFSLQIIREALLLDKSSAIHGDNPVFSGSDFKIANFSKLIHEENTHGILKEIDQAVYEISRSVNIKIVMTDLSIRLHYLMKRGVLPEALQN